MNATSTTEAHDKTYMYYDTQQRKSEEYAKIRITFLIKFVSMFFSQG